MKNDAIHDERLGPEELSKEQARKLAAMLAQVADSNPFYRRKLASVCLGDAPRIDDLPFTTRAELEEDQRANPPYGTNLTYPLALFRRLHQTSGSSGTPLRWLDTEESWAWWLRCWAQVFHGAGVTPEDRIAFLFSFGPFIGFWSAFESAAALGNLCLPAGGMTTLARLHYIHDHGITVVCCTPTYALHASQTAMREGLDLAASSVRALIVAGEPGGSVPAIRSRIESAWGARVFDHAGMTEIGAWGFECVEAPGGMHVIGSEFIAEAIDPNSLQSVIDGEEGELVLTNLGRIGSPLIRYRTGDRVRLERGHCACGRWSARAVGGLLGRIDDMLVIRGNNVFPQAIEGILCEFAEVAEYRLEVIEAGNMRDLRIDIEPASVAAGIGLDGRIVDAVRDRLHFRPQVRMVEPGSLPRFEMKAKRVIRRT